MAARGGAVESPARGRAAAPFVGRGYLAPIAMIEGDRQRACRHHCRADRRVPPGSDGVAATYRLLLARDLCYLGRFDEAEPLLRQSLGRSGRPRSARAMAPPSRRSSSPRAANSSRRRRSRARRRRRGDRDGQCLAPGWGHEDLASVLERAGRIDEARGALERALASGSGSAACPTCAASASRSTRSGGRSSDATKRRSSAPWRPRTGNVYPSRSEAS